MYYAYVIKSLIKKWVYIGCTDDLRRRIQQHQAGKTSSTKPYRPFKLIYYEAYLSKADARKREYQLKHHNQSKELLLKQVENSLNMALSSNG